MSDLAGKVAMVTGTAHGIGSGIAAALEAHGAHVHGCDRDTVDVSDAAQVAQFVAQIGRVDILVNNAGGVVGQVGRSLDEVSDADWQAIVDANLTSTFVCTRAVAPGMKERGWEGPGPLSTGGKSSAVRSGVVASTTARSMTFSSSRTLPGQS